MPGFMQRRAAPPSGPVLELSGPRLRRAFEHLVDAAEPTGGVERYVSALALKASLFGEILGTGKVRGMTDGEFRDLAAFVSPVRRRIAEYLEIDGFGRMRERLAALLEDWSDTSTADARLLRFMAQFPQGKSHRWVRNLGAEVLHFVAPDRYPLMARWVWDARAGTGVLREIWYSDLVDDAAIDVDDSFETFAALTTELSAFLSANGVFRDHVFYSDLLCAHVYAGYINDRGGQYLRSDFSDGTDPMTHTRRMLGLDAIDTETGRTRLKLLDGTAHVLGSAPMMLS